MSKERNFVKAVEVIAPGTLSITTLSTGGKRRTVEVAQTAANPLALLGCCVHFAFAEGEDTRAMAMRIEDEVTAYFPPEKLFFYSPEDENLDRIKLVHTVVVGPGHQLPAPFTAAGVQLTSGHVVGFERGTNLKQLLEQDILWTLGEESETQALAERIPEHAGWLEHIQEHHNGEVEVRIWHPVNPQTQEVESVEKLLELLGVRQITSDLIGEAVSAELKHLPGSRRGVPNPYFYVQTPCLNPDTLWHYAEVIDDEFIEFWGKVWELKEPVDSNEVEALVVTASDLILNNV